MANAKPCPFCGSWKELEAVPTLSAGRSEQWCVVCHVCATRGPLTDWFDDREKAIDAAYERWNERGEER